MLSVVQCELFCKNDLSDFLKTKQMYSIKQLEFDYAVSNFEHAMLTAEYQLPNNHKTISINLFMRCDWLNIMLCADVYVLSNDFVSELLRQHQQIRQVEKLIFLCRLEEVSELVAFSWLWLQYFEGLAFAQRNLTLKAKDDFQQLE